MKVDRVATNLSLWRAVRPLLPESVQDLRVEKCVIKFRMTPRGGTKAEILVDYVEGEGYDFRKRKRKAAIMEPYRLFDTLKDLIRNWPEAATSLDLTIDPNGPAKIKTTYIPLLKEEA